MDRDESNTPTRRVERIISNPAFSRISTPSGQEVRQQSIVRNTNRSLEPSEELAKSFPALYQQSLHPNRNTTGSSSRVEVQSQRYPYNPQQNYRPRPERRQRSSPYPKPARLTKTFVKTVVLVNQGEDVVPKGKKRQQAHDEGRVVDMMEFSNKWCERECIGAIEKAFQNVFSPGPSPK